MRNVRPISLLLVGIVACTTQHSGSREGPPSAAPNAPAGVAGTTGGAGFAGSPGTPGSPAPPTVAPPLRGTLADGKSFDLHELRGDRVVLIFYRTAYCGLCSQQLRALAADKKLYSRLDAKVVAITQDPPELIRRTAQILDLDFPIVSVDRPTLTRWGVWPDGARTPRPAAFIVAENGEIIFHQIGQSAADRASDATIAFTLRALDAQRNAE